MTSSLTEQSPVGMIREKDFILKNQRAFTPLGVFTTAASEEANPHSYSVSFTHSADPFVPLQ